MTRNVAQLLLIASLALFATQNTVAANITRTADQIILDGSIERGDHAKLTALLPGAKHLILTSTGGMLEEVLNMSKTISDTSIEIRVRGVCSGDCASMLFLAAKDRAIEEDGLIAFSMTSIAYQQALLEEERTFNAWQNDPELAKFIIEKSEQLQALQQRLFNIYTKRMIPKTTITLVNQLTAPDKDSFMMGMTGSGEGTHELLRDKFLMTSTPGRGYEYFSIFMGQSKCAYWAPNENQLSMAGIKLVESYSRPWPWKITKLLELGADSKVYPGNLYSTSSMQSTCNRKITLQN